MLCSFNKIMGLVGILLLIVFGGSLQAAPEEKVGHDERCSVCGMFVAKYENWVVQVRFADERVMFFDGVKDMLVFYFNPRKYSDKEQQDISEIWVKDYYSLGWLDGRKAFYVIGSDVYGPMGKEFIPFDSRESADNFLRDHQGREILQFEEITDDLAQSMRSGSKMRHGDN